MDDADDVTLDQVVQAMVLDAIARGSDQTRIALRGDELQASYFDSVEFRVGISVPAEWFDRVEHGSSSWPTFSCPIRESLSEVDSGDLGRRIPLRASSTMA